MKFSQSTATRSSIDADKPERRF